MSEHYFDINLCTLRQLSSEIGVILCVLPLILRVFFFHLFPMLTFKFRNNQIRFLLLPPIR